MARSARYIEGGGILPHAARHSGRLHGVTIISHSVRCRFATMYGSVVSRRCIAPRAVSLRDDASPPCGVASRRCMAVSLRDDASPHGRCRFATMYGGVASRRCIAPRAVSLRSDVSPFRWITLHTACMCDAFHHPLGNSRALYACDGETPPPYRSRPAGEYRLPDGIS